MKTQKTSEKEPFYDFIDMETVAFLMKKNRWDVKYMAEKVGVTPATFRRWLKSTSPGYLSADAVVKIAWALQTTIFTVLSYNCKIVRGKEKAQIPKEK